jgi:type IV pilus assembly protein PilC
MAKFRYKAKNIDNKIMKGVLFAKDEEELRQILSNQKYFLVSARKISESTQFFTFLERVSPDVLAIFCREFAIMISAGITITKAIETLKTSTRNRKLREILEEVHIELLKGRMLSDSLEKYPKTFPVFFRNMIRIGEISGRLDKVLPELADYYENDTKVKKQVRSAMAYPTFMVILSIAVVAVLSLFVIPIFGELFSSFDAELPKITQILIAVSDFFRMNFGFIVLGIFLLALLLKWLKSRPMVRLWLDQMKLVFPVVKNVVIAQITARFTSGLSTLLKSGIPVVDAISTMGKMLGNKAVEERFAISVSEIKRGQGIAKAIKTIDLFPDMLIQMLVVGEETAELELVLDKTSGYFGENVNASIKRMVSIIEPLMTILVGFMVLFVIVSVFIPMLDLMNAIDRLG